MTSSWNKKIGIAILMGTTAISGALPTFAEEANEETFMLDEIFVTASRREQVLQDVPAAVAAIKPEEFTLKGLTSVTEMLQYVPAIRVLESGNPGQGSIAARGIPQSGSTPVFGIYLDDTPLTSSTALGVGDEVFFDGALIDIERIEVIKGPQGTLYGATSVGGMLKYVSRKPALEEIRASGAAEFNSVKEGGEGYRFSGRVSVPIVKDQLGITVSAYTQEIAGYLDYVDGATGDFIEEDADSSELVGYAADVLWTPNEDLELRFKYLKQEMDTQLSSSVLLAGPETDDAVFGGFTNVLEPGPISIDYEIISGSLSYDFGGVVLNSTSSYSKYTFGIVQDVVFLAPIIDSVRDDGQTTTGATLADSKGAERFVQEVRLTSDTEGSLEWIAGFFFVDEDTFSVQNLSATPDFLAAFADFPSSYKEYAGFGDITYYFTENFDLTAGIRVSRSEIAVNFSQTGPFAGGDVDLLGENITDTVETYLFAARYRVNENLSLYGRIASGYRPVQGNIPLFTQGENAASPIIESDSTWSYEIGAKGSFADGMVDFEVALWKIDWDNFQAIFTLGGGINVGANAEDGLSAQGFESSLVIRPTDSFTINGTLSYTDSSLNSDEPELGGLAGVQYPDIPEWQGSLQWNWAFELGSDWAANFGGGLRYRGGFVSGFPASETEVAVPVSGGVLADLNLNVTNGRFGIGLYANNLFNRRQLNDRTDSIFDGEPTNFGVFERPRTIGVILNVDI